jgi:type II secretory pathway pseudopilin PulG
MERLRQEAGETLLEILITMVVLGIGVVAVMGLMASTIIGSDAHRNQAAAEVVAREYGELIKQKQRSLDPVDFVPCPGETELEPAPAFDPDGWNVAIESVEWWVPTSDVNDFPNGEFVENRDLCIESFEECLENPADAQPNCDPGAQRVAIAVDNVGVRDDYGRVAITHELVLRRNAE